MSFQSLSYLLFLAVTVAACLLVGRKNRTAALLLLALACALFCLQGQNGLASLWVIFLGCCVTQWAAGRVADGKNRPVMVLACLYHVAVLAVFKYAGFVTGGAWSMGWAPLGLSFFTFQQLWFLKEIYTGEYQLQREDSVHLYAFFFPTLTSGPILRPSVFFPQLRSERFLHPDWEDIAAGVYAICCGTVKKVLLADAFGTVVQNGWNRLEDLSAPMAWMVILGYSLQLYLDFSGYCDIAAGSARLLGLRLPVNFDSPYHARSVGEFWKRWHITLTTFLRECVYIPLGGNRKGAARTYLHIIIVYLISGIWHGAGWTFLLWGGLHGLAQVAERAAGEKLRRVPGLLRWALTFLFVNIAWVFFRAPDVSGALTLLHQAVMGGLTRPEAWILQGLFSKETGAVEMLFPALRSWTNLLRLGILYGTGMLVVLWRRNTIRRMDDFSPAWWQGVLLVVATAWSVLSFSGITGFIYSNF